MNGASEIEAARGCGPHETQRAVGGRRLSVSDARRRRHSEGQRPRLPGGEGDLRGVRHGGLILLGGISTRLGYGSVIGELATQVAVMIRAALVQVPAVLVLAGVVVVLFGLLPRWSVALSWTALTAFLLLGQLGAVLELPQQVLNLSPYTHIPAVPAVDPTALPLAVLTGVAVALITAGPIGFRRRDLAT